MCGTQTVLFSTPTSKNAKILACVLSVGTDDEWGVVVEAPCRTLEFTTRSSYCMLSRQRWSLIDLLKGIERFTEYLSAHISQTCALSVDVVQWQTYYNHDNFLLNEFPVSSFGKMEHHSEVRTLKCELMFM